MLGESVKWRENTSRPGEVERAGMDATEYTYGAKQTDAAIRAVASRYRDRRAATSRDNDNKLSPSLSRSRSRPHPSPARTYPRSARVYYASVARARGDSSLQRSEQHLSLPDLHKRNSPEDKGRNEILLITRAITFDSSFRFFFRMSKSHAKLFLLSFPPISFPFNSSLIFSILRFVIFFFSFFFSIF